MTHFIKYNRYPNNEIRAVHYYRARPKETASDDPGLVGDSCEPLVAASPDGERSAGPPSYLDISSEVHAFPQKKERKRTKFGLPARRSLLRAGGALDTVCSKPHYYVMLTGTLPGGTPEAMSAIAEESHWIVDSIGKWLRKYYESEYWFYVWELQDRGALHIHWCVYLPDTHQRCKLLWNWWDKWKSILQAVQKKTRVDLWRRKDGSHHIRGHAVLQADAQTVFRSVAAYLAGYCSDGKNKHAADRDSPYFPDRWWGYSRPLKKLVDSLTDEVVIQHTNYRDAKYEMQVHYEQVLHDSPKAYRYQHKVGIGSTIVSYHPEDKGQKTWQPLKPMLYKPQSQPNTSYMIASYRRLAQETTSLLEASPKQVNLSLKPLLTTLRECHFSSAARGYTISQKDITIIRLVDCTLNSPLCILKGWERLRLKWCHLQDSIATQSHLMKWDRFGYLCSIDPEIGLLDTHWSLKYLSTTDPDGEAATGGVANGSISPQTPTHTQLDVWHS